MKYSLSGILNSFLFTTLVPVPDSRMPDACFQTQFFLHFVLCHRDTRAQAKNLETVFSTAAKYQQDLEAEQSTRGEIERVFSMLTYRPVA